MDKNELFETIMRCIDIEISKVLDEMERPSAEAIASSGMKINKKSEWNRYEKYLQAAVKSFNEKYAYKDKDMEIRAYVFYNNYDDVRLEMSYNGKGIYSPYLGGEDNCKDGSKWRIYKKDDCPYRPDYVYATRQEALMHLVKDMPRPYMERVKTAVQAFEKLQKQYADMKEKIKNGEIRKDDSLDWINESRRPHRTIR